MQLESIEQSIPVNLLVQQAENSSKNRREKAKIRLHEGQIEKT